MYNSLWRDTIEACNSFFNNAKNAHTISVYSLSIWYNSQIYNDVNKDKFHKYIRDFLLMVLLIIAISTSSNHHYYLFLTFLLSYSC